MLHFEKLWGLKNCRWFITNKSGKVVTGTTGLIFYICCKRNMQDQDLQNHRFINVGFGVEFCKGCQYQKNNYIGAIYQLSSAVIF